MSPATDFLKFEEVYILYIIWDTLLGHVVCKEGLLVDQAKIVVILGHGGPHFSQGIVHHLGHTGITGGLFKVM
jgi:hypothetical protein